MTLMEKLRENAAWYRNGPKDLPYSDIAAAEWNALADLVRDVGTWREYYRGNEQSLSAAARAIIARYDTLTAEPWEPKVGAKARNAAGSTTGVIERMYEERALLVWPDGDFMTLAVSELRPPLEVHDDE